MFLRMFSQAVCACQLIPDRLGVSGFDCTSTVPPPLLRLYSPLLYGHGKGIYGFG